MVSGVLLLFVDFLILNRRNEPCAEVCSLREQSEVNERAFLQRLYLDEEHAFVGIGHSNSDMEAADLDLKAERVASPSPFQYRDLPTAFKVSSLAATRWWGGGGTHFSEDR